MRSQYYRAILLRTDKFIAATAYLRVMGEFSRPAIEETRFDWINAMQLFDLFNRRVTERTYPEQVTANPHKRIAGKFGQPHPPRWADIGRLQVTAPPG